MAVSVQQIAQWKQGGSSPRPIAVLTAWDVISAAIVDQAGADMVLVGDSLAMVALGHPTTLPLTLEEMLQAARAVRRGVKNALMVVDLPFLSYQVSPEEAIGSAGRVLKETGAQAVKLEGGHGAALETIGRLRQWDIPVMGHVGLTPQSIHQLGGFRQQGQGQGEADRIFQEALDLAAAGVFALVLEHIPAALAAQITQALPVPTIGIGAGPACDGQVLVTADVLGLSTRQPPFAKVYANLRQGAITAAEQFCQEVRSGQFPPA
jgi:3-methyl-2-oxobutanoate hydroxymethyltransferase